MDGNSENICKALTFYIRTSNDNLYVIGDSLYYKRASNRRCRGLAKVVEKDGQQVLVKHGGVCLLPSLSSLIRTVKQHEQSSQTPRASSYNSDSDSDSDTPEIIEPPRQKLTVTNSNETSSDKKDEHADNYESLKQKYQSKKKLSLMLRIFHCPIANSQLSQRKHPR